MRELTLLLLVACGNADSPGGGNDTNSTDADTDTDADADTDADTDTTGATTGGTDDQSCPGVKGILVDPTGAVLPFTSVMCCKTEYCLFADSAEDGSFSFCDEAETDFAVKTHESMSPKWAAALVPVHSDNHTVDLGNVYVPDLGPGAIVGDESEDPQALDVGDGLRLTLNRGDLKLPFGVFLVDIAARLLPAEDVPDYPAVNGETVLAVYALHPFSVTSSSPIAVRIPSTLAAGTPVNFWQISELNGSFVGPILGHADGTYAMTDAGEGLDDLTYLVVTTP